MLFYKSKCCMHLHLLMAAAVMAAAFLFAFWMNGWACNKSIAIESCGRKSTKTLKHKASGFCVIL